jgi:hypothetical protein
VFENKTERKIMKIKILFALTALCISGCASVQPTAPGQQDSRVSAEKLLDVLNTGESFDNAIRQAVGMQTGMLDKMNLSEEQLAQAHKSMESSTKLVREKFSWEKMKPMFVDIYAEVFTAKELDDITAFYESPEGQKFVEKQPELMRVTMQKMQGLMAEIMPEIQKETAKMVEQLKTETFAKPAVDE